MSLVSTYVQSREGNWFKNPEVVHPAWFICWDDDDPIELVFKFSVISRIEIMAFLGKVGWAVKVKSRAHGPSTQRLFANEFHHAEAWFLEQLDSGPPEEILKGENLGPVMPDHQGVYYFNGPNGHDSQPISRRPHPSRRA
jgi:hypothetical protein